MIIRTCAWTTEGWKLADRISENVKEHFFDYRSADEEVDSWVEAGFGLNAPILFIGALGIAVRKIAPFGENKLIDSPVIVTDEKGQFVIPVLSGHVGGANELARDISKAINAQLVLTTATDVQNVFAIDVFAKHNGLRIVNKDGIKKISSKLLNGNKITMVIDSDIEYSSEEVPDYIDIIDYKEAVKNSLEIDVYIANSGSATAGVLVDADEASVEKNPSLLLEYKPYIIGIGCRKNIEFEKLDTFVKEQLECNDIDINLVAGIGTIDIKKSEKGLLYFETKNRIPLVTFSAQELQEVEGEFSNSDFVKEITGVSNVCERAAMKLAGEEGELLLHKIAQNGMTLAVSRRKARINVWKN